MDSFSDEQMKELAKKISESESGISVAVPEKVKAVNDVFNALKRIIKGHDVNITCDLNEPYVSMGAVTVIGKEIFIGDPVVFSQAVKSASNFEVYPKTDGKIQMDFTFHGLTRKAGK